MVRRHHKTKLFRIQQARSNSIRRPRNGRPIFRTSCPYLPATHRTHTHTHLAHLTHKHRIMSYCRYVDDILLILDSTHSSKQMILDDFNALHPKLQFTAETERDHTLNYLDISIHRTPTNIKTAIYRKPTFMDTTNPYTSIYPTYHK